MYIIMYIQFKSSTVAITHFCQVCRRVDMFVCNLYIKSTANKNVELNGRDNFKLFQHGITHFIRKVRRIDGGWHISIARHLQIFWGIPIWLGPLQGKIRGRVRSSVCCPYKPSPTCTETRPCRLPRHYQRFTACLGWNLPAVNKITLQFHKIPLAPALVGHKTTTRLCRRWKSLERKLGEIQKELRLHKCPIQCWRKL